MKIIIILILAIVITSTVMWYYTEDYNIKGTVIEHNVTSDKYGNRTYCTLINCQDGYIREETDLRYYVLPKGKVVTLKLTKLNFSK